MTATEAYQLQTPSVGSYELQPQKPAKKSFEALIKEALDKQVNVDKWEPVAPSIPLLQKEVVERPV